MASKLRDIVNDEFTGKYELVGFAPPDHNGRRPFLAHDIFHIFSKSRLNDRSGYANKPDVGSELIADIYEVVMKRLPRLSNEDDHLGVRDTGILGKGAADLALEEVEIYLKNRLNYFQRIVGMDISQQRLPKHQVIDYHMTRASWLRKNIEDEYGVPFDRMNSEAWGDLDLDKIMFCKGDQTGVWSNAPNQKLSFEDWRIQCFEPWLKSEPDRSSGAMSELYPRYINHRTPFLDKGLPVYAWETELPGSDRREVLKYLDDYSRANRLEAEVSEQKVVYILNYQNGGAGFYLATDKPPYDENGKFVADVEACSAIVTDKNSLQTFNCEPGVYRVYTDSFTHMHLPLPDNAKAPDWGKTAEMFYLERQAIASMGFTR